MKKKLPRVNFINILRAPFALVFLHQKLQSQIVTREKLRKALLYEKFAHKRLIKLTPRSDYIADCIVNNKQFKHSIV